MILRCDAGAGTLTIGTRAILCAIGRGGAVAAVAKREGDGATPLGSWALRAALLRPDRVPPTIRPGLPWRWLRAHDGWCDDPADPAYNRPVRHLYPASAEWLWRDDGLYDAIVLLAHNDAPPVAGAGSAIFLHCRGEGATEGCVAIERGELLALLPRLTVGDRLVVA